MKSTKRQMMHIPEVNPNSFVFFYEKGSSGNSWSIRDYSFENKMTQFGPRDFPWTAGDIHLKARHSFDAERISTENLTHWHQLTLNLNASFLRHAAPVDPAIRAATASPVSFARGLTAPSSTTAVAVLNNVVMSDFFKWRREV